jgi:uncharacterized glyoxalase superfamily protein PhnB
VTQTVYPTLRYRDPEGAIYWLERALGFMVEAELRDDNDEILHAELSFRGNRIMLGAVGSSQLPPSGPAWIYLVADDVDGLHGQAVEHGAEVVIPIKDMDYGSREFTVKDGDGHLWSIGTYQPDTAG